MPLRFRPSILLAALAVLGPAAHAQPFSDAYAFGGTQSDVAEAVAVDAEGNSYVAGTFDGTIDFGNGVVITSAGDSDAFLVKFDADGTARWARRAGTDVFNDFGENVAVEHAASGGPGAVYVAGTFTGVATFDGGANPDTTITTFSDFDAFLARYTPDGDLEWVRRVGGVEQDVAEGVAVTGSFDTAGERDVYLVGSFTDQAEAGDTTLVSAGGSDAYLVRYTPSGDFVWARSAGGTESETAYDVAVTADGDAFVAGQFYGVAVFDDGIALQSVGASDIFVARYGDDASVAWAERLGGSDSDYVRGIALDAQGDTEEPHVYVGGAFSNTVIVGPDILTSAGFTDVLTAALDADGAVLWGRRGGGANFDFAEDIQSIPPYFIATLGGDPNHVPPIYVTGYVDGAGTFDDPETTISVMSAGGQDGFLVAYQNSDLNGGAGGALLDAFTFGGTNSDRGTGVTVLPQDFDLDPLLTGYFRDTATFGDLTLTSTGSNDGFLARLTSCPVLFCVPTATESVSPDGRLALAPASPNPTRATTTLALTLARPERVTAGAYDVLGRRVAVLHEGLLPAGTHPLTLDGARVPSGLYVVRVSAAGTHVARTVTVAR